MITPDLFPRGLARLVLVGACLTPGCTLLDDVDLERMIEQDKYRVWEPAPFFADGRAMRTPPQGTLARGTPVGDPAVNQGVSGGAPVTEIPIPITRARITAGRARYDTWCAPCHGVAGDGQSVVAANMDLRRPPIIAGPGARDLPAGRVYQVIDLGYGLMRSYAEDLSTPEERWSVVAYLIALGRSRATSLADLPPELRRAAEEALP